MRIIPGMAQFVGIVLLLVSCSALSAQNPGGAEMRHSKTIIAFEILFWFTALGRMLPAGKASTTFS